ncbi:MAG: EcoAI/FtnUII family type I restriction enzme subunit R [Candidatus Promineifilaceae bacterium]
MNKKSLTEQEIRTNFITPALQDSGWILPNLREEYYFTDGKVELESNQKPKRGKRLFADYLLIYESVPLAIVEAKDNKQTVGAGMQQALKYAEILDVPFVYSSNGDGFVEHDKLNSYGQVERVLTLDQFPSPDELWERYTRGNEFSAEQQSLITQPYYSSRNTYAPRYYQRIAIQRTITAIAQGQKRILLVMATGTGKTFTAFQIVWRLWKAKRVKRVLFLADRNVLIDQTMTGDFKHFGDVMHKVKNRETPKAYEVYLALYQAVTGTEEAQNIYKQFSPDFFDLIVIDECHRGSASADSAWREILNYFDSAVHLGLTATPTETKTVSNSDYFGDPLYTYSLKRGIEDGFLAPYKVVRVDVDVDVDGWTPHAGQTDKHGNVIDSRDYGLRDWDKTIVLEQRNELVAQRTADYLATLDPYSKTIVFCVDIAHAERMRRQLVNAIGDEAAVERRYVMRITGDNPEGKAQLDSFIATEERYPVIATTSKLMTTGVDAKMCKVIVLDTVINSMTEFKQIIGRGTRLNFDAGKTHFTIIDFRNATRLFKDEQFDGTPVQEKEYNGNRTPPAWTPSDEPPFDEGDKGSVLREKFYVDDVAVEILAERVQYYDEQGNLITKSFVDFGRSTILQTHRSLDRFLETWNSAERKQEVMIELFKNQILLEKLEQEVSAETGQQYDPFDLICHIAFDKPALTRSERAKKVKQDNVYTQYSGLARRVLDGLLNKYTDDGVAIFEQAADPRQAQKLLKLDPFNKLDSPQQIARAFGGIRQYVTAVKQVKTQIYCV